MAILLVTGPSRSGKSSYAERLALDFSRQSSCPVIYVATAQAYPEDVEWQARIELHRQQRPSDWTVLEVPKHLPDALGESECVYLVDSLGTWVANWIEADAGEWETLVDGLLQALASSASDVIVVSEETGWGVVPAYEMGRLFRDRLGLLSQKVGQIADQAYLVVAGFAIDLHTAGIRIETPEESENDN